MGGPDDGGGADGVFGGSGGGAAAAGGIACLGPYSRKVRCGVRGARLGGGGGAAEDFLSPWKGGGTPNLGLSSFSSSSIGVFGGRGGGGGPGFAIFEVARGRLGRLGAGTFANLPASASGGGALNWYDGCGGEGVRLGDIDGDF